MLLETFLSTISYLSKGVSVGKHDGRRIFVIKHLMLICQTTNPSSMMEVT